MRANDHVAQARVLRHLGAQRHRAARLGPALLEQLPHARRVDDAAGVGIGERHVELGGAILTQQANELICNAADGRCCCADSPATSRSSASPDSRR